MRTPSAFRTVPRVLLVASGLAWLAACRYATAPETTDTTTTGSTTSSPTTLTYTTDVAPILNADCIRCHGGSNRQAGVDLSTYQTVMRTVTAGNANSILILVTQSGGLMNNQLSGNRTAKAATIHDWIVSSNAAQ